MTVGTPAAWAGSANHPIRVVRNIAPAIWAQPVTTHANSATATTRGGSYGVAAGGDMAVTTTGALGYSIAAGRCAFPGTTATAQGGYVAYNDAAVTGTLPARDASNPYIAYIAGRMRDTDEDATGAEIFDLTVIQGTAAATPAAPSIPSSLGSLIILSEALVPSSANGGPVQFTERRKYLAAVGGIQRVTSSTNPTGVALWAGVPFYETDTGDAFIYDGSVKRPFLDIWQSYTPTWAAPTVTPSIGNGTLTAFYAVYGKTCHLNIWVSFGSTTSGGSGGWSFTLPPGITAAGTAEWYGVAKMFSASAGQNMMGYVYIPASSTTLQPWMPTDMSTANTVGQVRNADATGAVSTGVPLVAGNYPFTSTSNLSLQISFPIA